MHANANNRIDGMSPELAVQLKATIAAAVQEITDQFRAAVKAHPEDFLEAHNKYFGTV